MRTFTTIAPALSSALMAAGPSVRVAPTAAPAAVPPAVVVAAAEPGEGAREAIEVSGSWMFVREEVPAAEAPDFDFEGSHQITDIRINSEYVTTHRGAFAGFGSDSSDYVTAGGNEISVSVENRWCQELALRASDHRNENKRILLAPGKSTSVSFVSRMKSVVAETATMIGPASGRESSTSTPATCS